MNKKTLAKIIMAGLMIGLVTTVGYADAGSSGNSIDMTGNTTQASQGAWSGIVTQVNTVIAFVYWIMYIVAAVLITMAGFKLKQGDIPGFAKTLIGGMAVFGSKFLIQALFRSVNSASS